MLIIIKQFKEMRRSGDVASVLTNKIILIGRMFNFVVENQYAKFG